MTRTAMAPMTRLRPFLPVFLIALLAVFAEPALAQDAGGSTALGAQTMRPFRFLFAAYAVAWLLVFGWVVSVSRRLAGVERRLRD